MKPIAIFYHCYFFNGSVDKPHRPAIQIVDEQMKTLVRSKLCEAATFFCVGLNGGTESMPLAERLIPNKAEIVYHGLRSKNENPTIVEIEKWVLSHPGWHVLYFHPKGASHPPGSMISQKCASWRSCMMKHLVLNWRQCVADLESGYESVGVHWMRGLDATQNYWAGNFWWAESDYLRSLPSIFARQAIKLYGLDTPTSRYESEVWIGNGPKLPKRKDYHPQPINSAH